MLRAAFVRTGGQPDRIYVTRSDGSEASWSFPTYGDGLPHDLVHLVVESAFGLRSGFWGRVDAGADPKRINAEANRKGGSDKYATFGPDRSELDLAEALAAAPWGEATVEDSVRAAYARLGRGAPAELGVEGPAGPGVEGPAELGVEGPAEHGVDAPAEGASERIRETRQALLRLSAAWRGLNPKGTLNVVFHRERPRAGFEQMFLAEKHSTL